MMTGGGGRNEIESKKDGETENGEKEDDEKKEEEEELKTWPDFEPRKKSCSMSLDIARSELGRKMLGRTGKGISIFFFFLSMW